MLGALTAIFACQLAGELGVAATGLPLPGPVVGMAILFLALQWRGEVPDALARVGEGLLSHLSLLFVPAGTGIVIHLTLLADQAVPVLIGLIVPTLLTIAVTGLVMARLTKDGEAREP